MSKFPIRFTTAVPKVFFSEAQIWVWWTPRDPRRKHRIKKILIVWVTCGSKLLSSIPKSEIYTFLEYLCATERHRQAGDVENTQFSFGSPRRDPFFDPSRPLFGSLPILWEPLFYQNKQSHCNHEPKLKVEQTGTNRFFILFGNSFQQVFEQTSRSHPSPARYTQTKAVISFATPRRLSFLAVSAFQASAPGVNDHSIPDVQLICVKQATQDL